MRLRNTLPCQSPKSSCIESKWHQETLILRLLRKWGPRQRSHRVATIEIAYTLDMNEPPKQLERQKLSIHALSDGTGCL